MYVVHVANSKLICILRFVGGTNLTGPSLSVASMNLCDCCCFKFHVRNVFLVSWRRGKMIFQNQKHVYNFHVLHFIRVTRFFPKVSLCTASPLAATSKIEERNCGWNFYL